jgi:flap endonuclease-1
MGAALKNIVQEFAKPHRIEDLSGIVAIDAFNTLYQFLTIIRQPDGTPLMDAEGRVTSHLSGIFYRTISMLEAGLQPVFIFDGKPPELKQATNEKRRAQRDEAEQKFQEAQRIGDTQAAYKYARAAARPDEVIIQSAQDLLTAMNIPYLTAPSEGEAQAAHMVTKGDVTYAASQDYDTLLFGAPTFLRNLTVSGKRKFQGRTIQVQPEIIHLKDLLSGLALTHEELIQIAILTGTDFNPGVSGIGAKKGLKVVKSGEFQKTLEQASQTDIDYDEIMEFFLHPPITNEYELRFKPLNSDLIGAFLCDNYGFSEEKILHTLKKVTNIGEQKSLEQWF